MDDNHKLPAAKELLEAHFSKHGLLLCGASPELPSIFSVGGDWNAIVALVEEGQVFYSKFYKNRVTYLSRAFYAQVKHYRQRIGKVSGSALKLFHFLDEVGTANTKEIKRILGLSGQNFSKAMLELNRELLVTAIRRDETMNQNWSSFCWGTWRTWESMHPISDVAISPERAADMLAGLMSEKKISSLLR